MNKIIKSLSVVAFVAAIATGATLAYFHDTETSTGNVFKAGSIDLKIDSECHYNGMICECDSSVPPVCTWQDDPNVLTPPVESKTAFIGGFCDCTWAETDLDDSVNGEKFFNFSDLKPGDNGENTISMHVYDNDAWGKIYLNNVFDLDNDCVDPELEDEPNCGNDNTGELDENMEAIIWLDQGQTPGFQGTSDTGEGDNIWNGPCEEPLITLPITANFTYELDEIIKESYQHNACYTSGVDCPGLTEDGHLVGCVTYYIGVAWCFGEWDPSGVCDGSLVDNQSQTDSLGGDLIFEAVQYRNNPTAVFTP